MMWVVCLLLCHKSLALPVLNVAFLLSSAPDESGYAYMHHQGVQQLQTKFRGNITTRSFVLKANEPASVEQMRALILQRNFDLVIGTSFDHQSLIQQLAADFPTVKFLSVSGQHATSPNLSTGFGRIFQARYLSGMLAGLKTDTGKLCYNAAKPIPEVYRGVHAFTLGVKAVRPEAEVFVRWIGSWANPALERYAAEEALALENCDIIAMHLDGLQTSTAANKAGKYSIGYNTDMSARVGGETVLTSVVWNWFPMYEYFVNKLLQGNWKSEAFWKGYDSQGASIVDLAWSRAKISGFISSDIAKIVLKARQKLISGKLKVFCGTAVQLPEDQCFDDTALLGDDIVSFQSGFTDRGVVKLPEVHSIIKPCPASLQIAVIVPAVVTVLVALAISAVYVKYRNTPLIKAGSWQWDLVIQFCAAIAAGSSVFFVVEPNSAFCSLRWWLPILSVVTLLGAMLVKTHRLHRIFNRRKIDIAGNSLTNSQLVKELLVVLIVPVVLLTTSTILHTPVSSTREISQTWNNFGVLSSSKESDSSWIVSNSLVPTCTMNVPFTMATVGYLGFLQLALIVVAYRVRDIPGYFNESKYLGAAIYCILTSSVVCGTCIQLLPEGNDARAVLLAYSVIAGMGGALMFLYLRKLYVLYTSGGKENPLSTMDTVHKVDAKSRVIKALTQTIDDLKIQVAGLKNRDALGQASPTSLLDPPVVSPKGGTHISFSSFRPKLSQFNSSNQVNAKQLLNPDSSAHTIGVDIVPHSTNTESADDVVVLHLPVESVEPK